MNDYELVIVGSGIAGLFGAIRASAKGLRVLLVSKEGLLESNSAYAQGGIAAALGDHDSPELHFRDTLAAGDGLCYEPSVRVLVEEGVDRVRELLDMGVKFDTYGEGDELALTREGAHSQRRILHAGGDATGREIVETLTDIVVSDPGIDVRDRFFVTRLLLEGGRCVGVEGFEEGGNLTSLFGKCVLLTTGGTGQVYSHTTNPPTATGDGMALAFLAGAEMSDMEFVQFHPTALSIPGQNPSFLISEAVRGEGAVLRDSAGERFMLKYHPLGELAPRDVVSRGILSEMVGSHADSVFLDFTTWPAAKAEERFPTIYGRVQEFGLDLSTQYIPVAPAAHYYMGGVRTDLFGRTNVPNLFACGEVACTYCHGANRLGSNSLLEGIVFTVRAVDAVHRGEAWNFETGAPERVVEVSVRPEDVGQVLDDSLCESIPVDELTAWLREVMWLKVGILRDAKGLEEASSSIRSVIQERFAGVIPKCRRALELRNMLLVGMMAAESAKVRTESRGGHYRVDFPAKDATWLTHTVMRGRVGP